MEGCAAGSTTDVGVGLAGDEFADWEPVASGGSPPEQAASRKSITMAGNLVAVMGDSLAASGHDDLLAPTNVAVPYALGATPLDLRPRPTIGM